MRGHDYFEITNHRNPFIFHSHIVGIYREGVDKYHLCDQLRLSQSIFNKRENERETVANLIITEISMYVSISQDLDVAE